MEHKKIIVAVLLVFCGIAVIFAMRWTSEKTLSKDKGGGEGTQISVESTDGNKHYIPMEEPRSIEEIEALKSDSDSGFLILVNKEHQVDSNYKPDDLEGLKYFAADRSEAGRYLRAEAASAFHELVEGALQEGHEIVVTTAYRSYGFQSTLYNNYVQNHGQQEADTFSAMPGKSEHQTGLAADVSSPSVGYSLTADYIDTAEGKWLSDNAHKFGFIIRFPKGKEDITGYMYEPWHIRYVGKTAAKYIYNNDITLEEFLQEEHLEKEI